jgi:hypothetical protein
VIRARPRKNFTVLSNELLQNRKLSFAAQGLLTHLLSLPEGWNINAQRLATDALEGRDAIRRLLKELEDKGYYRVIRRQAGGGRWETLTEVYPEPHRGLETQASAVQASVHQGSDDQASAVQALKKEPIESTNTKNLKPKTKDQDLKTALPLRGKVGAEPGAVVKSSSPRNNKQLADHFVEDCLRRARKDYGARPTGSCNRIAMAANIKRIRAQYELSAADIEQMMELYIQMPDLWNPGTHPGMDFVSGGTIARLRNNLQPQEVVASVPTTSGPTLAERRMREAIESLRAQEGSASGGR